ncbi:MAG: FapA family protein [Bacillaceae bacterium]|nr:FapA family protein [Bacillaceae bacterium]
MAGEEAVVKYFEISDRKPVIKEDGRADFYELKFIDQVKKGDWLGEKILPGLGTPGRTVTGEKIPSKKGKDKVIRYDRKTVIATEIGNKIVLTAKVDGAVEFKNGVMMVQDHLTIDGDVNTGTGNIDFDGSITIKGTINNGFSVTATKDISVLGEIGVGKVKKIHSKKGDIFIKGGVSGENEAILEAGKNIFVKYANDCKLIAGDTINIGLYSFGSDLEAKNVLLDSKKGRIIGGKIKAEVKVVSAFIGNQSGRQTMINVAGFDRSAIMEELGHLLREYKKVLGEADQLKREIDVYETVEGSLSKKRSKRIFI